MAGPSRCREERFLLPSPLPCSDRCRSSRRARTNDDDRALVRIQHGPTLHHWIAKHAAERLPDLRPLRRRSRLRASLHNDAGRCMPAALSIRLPDSRRFRNALDTR